MFSTEIMNVFENILIVLLSTIIFMLIKYIFDRYSQLELLNNKYADL